MDLIDKIKRAKRRADSRRKNQRDSLPPIKTDAKAWTKNNKKKKIYYAENDDGDFS